jgi:hypothetical protein
MLADARSFTASNRQKLPSGFFFRMSKGECMDTSCVAWCCKAKLKEGKSGHAQMKTWRGRPATNSSGSDNLLARVWALVRASTVYSECSTARGIQDLIDRGYAARNFRSRGHHRHGFWDVLRYSRQFRTQLRHRRMSPQCTSPSV